MTPDQAAAERGRGYDVSGPSNTAGQGRIAASQGIMDRMRNNVLDTGDIIDGILVEMDRIGSKFHGSDAPQTKALQMGCGQGADAVINSHGAQNERLREIRQRLGMFADLL